MKTIGLWLIVGILFAGAGYNVRNAHRRATVAAAWTREGVIVSASGPANRTLNLELANPDSRACPYMIKITTEDQALVGQIKNEGFTEISCGSVKAELR